MEWLGSIASTITSAQFDLTIGLNYEGFIFDVILSSIHQEWADAPPTCSLSKVVIPQVRCG